MNFTQLQESAPKVKIMVATKNHTWDQIKPIYSQGARDFGESKVQEALAKRMDTPSDISWHFIGTLQKNKVKKIIGKFVLIHSVDTFELAKKISDETLEEQKILLQVNIQHKNGFKPDELIEKFPELLKLPRLRIEGLMTMAPDTEDVALIRNVFREARLLKERLGLKELSMGMSHDYKIAIEEGATIIRVGTLLFKE